MPSRSSQHQYSYVRKLIRTVKSLMSACKKITSKKSRSEALHKFCDKTELDDNVQSIQNITKKISEKSSKNFSNNSVNTEKVSEKSLNNLQNSEKVEKVSEFSETKSNNSEKSLNNSEINSFNYVQGISTNLSENITGFT